jgi:hypothetical protein
MDFQWTNRLEIKPSWAADNPSTPRKRWCRSYMTNLLELMRLPGPHTDMNSKTPSVLGTPQTPIFGSNQDIPFMFNTAPGTPQPPPWAPPASFSPEKAFPKTSESKDVEMEESSPQRPEDKKVDHGRTVAAGAMRRVYNSRQKSHDRRVVRKQTQEGENGDLDRSDSDDETVGPHQPLAQNTSHHYTLNLPATPPHQPDLPYILLG